MFRGQPRADTARVSDKLLTGLPPLLLVLLLLFGGVALMVVLGERFARPPDPARMRRFQRWLLPLVGVMLVLSLIDHYT